MARTYFDHEKLRVYHEALRFVAFADAIVAELPMKLAARDQLDRPSTSIGLLEALGIQLNEEAVHYGAVASAEHE